MRIQYFLTAVFLFLLSHTGLAQDGTNVVNWKATSQKLSDKKFEAIIEGQIANGWHLYAKPDPGVGLTGFVANVKSSSVNADTISVLSPLTAITDLIFDNTTQKVAKENVSFKLPLNVGDTIPSELRIQLAYEVGNGKDSFFMVEKELTVALEGGVEITKDKDNKSLLLASVDLKNPASNCGEASKSKGLLTLFALGFLGGLVALLTPCVFPLIPLTVSFFTKKAGSRKSGIRNAFTYGFFIFLIYILLSLPFHFIANLNPQILNNISTNVYLNLFFFVIFIVFAISFFGYFEISLPGAVSSSADSKSNVSSIGGIFFMALTLALVSFSCTGPILGTLLAGSLTSDGGAMQLTFGMAGFGLALALPFGLFAMFPNWLNALPKSGGWLTTVKVVLGFLELAMALKFFSNADLTMHWGLLKREIFIGIWIIIFGLLSLYLFGKIRFPHDPPIKKLPKLRLILALLSTAFTLYLVPGLTNTKYANLKLISGFPPPLYYSIYDKPTECVLNLNCTRSYEQGLKMAKEQNKAILLDFTGYACVNCRKMEESVWTKPEVYKVLQDKFIIISLYVDDKKELPAGEQFVYTNRQGARIEIKTVGDKWATFQTENFENNSQPWYVILNTKEELMNHPVGYVPNEKEYLAWLQCGLNAAGIK
jgi:thiol:disulfide interchange protein